MTETPLPFNDRVKSVSPLAGTTLMSTDFELTREDGLTIVRVRATGERSALALGVDFSFPSGLGDQTGAIVALTSPSLEGDRYILIGYHPEERLSDFLAAHDFSSAKINAQLDALTLIAQEHRRDIERSVKVEYEATELLLPTPTPETVLGWDGSKLVNLSPLAINADLLAGALGLSLLKTATAQAARRVLGIADFATVAEAAGNVIDANQIFVRTAGCLMVGDHGGALYKKSPVEPSYAGKFQSADGAWWGMVSQNLHLRMFGEVGAEALLAAVNTAIALGRTEIETDADILTINSPVDMQGVGILGQGTIIANTSNLLNVGKLRNCVVRGFPTEGDILANLTSTHQTPKLLVCANPNDALWLFTNDANGRPLRHILRYDTFSSNPTDAGVSSQVWRPTDVFGLDKVFVYLKDGVRSGTWTSESTTPFGGFFGIGTVGGRAFRYRSATTENSEVTFTINATVVGQKCRVGIYSTAGASDTNEILVNGVSQRTFSAVLVAGFPLLLLEVALTAVGDNTVTVRKTSAGAASLSVIGANVIELSEYRGETIDEYAYGETARQYLYSTAANDYAFHSVDEDKWFGSLHGGETKRAEPVLLTDRTIVPIPNVQNSFVIAKTIEFQQRTEIRVGDDYMNVVRADTYRGDGHYQLSTSMAGNAKVDRAFTCMTAAHYNFRNVTYPREITSPAATELLGRSNMVTQIAPIGPTEQMVLSTQTTLFPMGGKLGANMLANGMYINNLTDVYSKVYYGPVAGSEVTLTQIAFKTERLFG